jgi:hypothetical protein
MKHHIISLVILLIIVYDQSQAQTIPVATSYLEEYIRKENITNTNLDNKSLLIRPVYRSSFTNGDSSYNLTDSFFNPNKLKPFSFSKEKGHFQLLPLSIKQQFNSHHPYGWNDGSFIPAKGYQTAISAGVYAKLGWLSFQLQPVFVYAQNSKFATFPGSHSDSIWKSYYYVLNRIDNPERFGNGRYTKVFPGQSSIRLNYKKLSLGVSTENLWWGPGMHNSLIMSNNAPGFKHITFNTTSPLLTKIGTFEGQIISGILEGSGILPDDTSRTFEGQQLYMPKKEEDRYINGMLVTWQPKWTRGLYLGLSRAFYQYKSNVPSSLNGYLPVVSAFFKDNAQDENQYGRDQLFSLFFRLVMPESKAEVYAEYGRNDHSQDSRDLLLEPEHARAYILGLRKVFGSGKTKQVESFIELTHLQNPPTQGVRALEGWYNHYQVRHGFTHKGQVLGAGIGPGGSSQTLGINVWKGINKLGFMLERIVRNNDFYYDAFAATSNFSRHWVDLSLNLNKSWYKNRFLYAANVAFIRSLNYQWRSKAESSKVDVNNLHANFSVSYLF